jgi:hypothetical protein
MRSRIKVVLLAAVLLSLLGAGRQLARAQEIDRAGPLVEAVVQSLNRTMPGIGQPLRFTYSFLEPTRDSSLGCPLLPGHELGRAVVPYRIMLFYPGASYTYHISADGSMLFPCDPQLPIGGPVEPGQQPYVETPVEVVIAAFLRSFPERGFPPRYTYSFSVPTADSSLGCPLLPGQTMARQVVPYGIVLSFEDADYVYYAAGDGSIVVPCDPKVPVGGPPQLGEEPFAPGSPVEAAVNAYTQRFPERGLPERFEFRFGLATTDSSLGCPLVRGETLATPVVPYAVTLYDGGVGYLYYASEDGSLVVPCDARLLE